jgi:hypothetical protein
MFAALEADFPEVRGIWNIGYVGGVMSMPSRTNAGEPRAFGYAKEKLVKVLTYRAEKLVGLTLEHMTANVAPEFSKWIYMRGWDKAAAAKGLKVPMMYVHSSDIPWSSLDAEHLVDITIYWMKEAFEHYGCDQFSACIYGPEVGMTSLWYASSYVRDIFFPVCNFNLYITTEFSAYFYPLSIF